MPLLAFLPPGEASAIVFSATIGLLSPVVNGKEIVGMRNEAAPFSLPTPPSRILNQSLFSVNSVSFLWKRKFTGSTHNACYKVHTLAWVCTDSTNSQLL